MTAIRPPPDDAETARFHAFVASPDLVRRRIAALKVATERLDSILKPAGFTRKAHVWSRQMPFGVARVVMRKSSGGYKAMIDLAFLPRDGHRPKDRPMSALSVELPNFYRPDEGSHVLHGDLPYDVIDHDPDLIDPTLAVLRDRALPWLLGHADGSFPDWRMFRAGD